MKRPVDMSKYAVVTLLDTEEAGWEEAAQAVEDRCRRLGYANRTYYIDFRKYRKGEAPATDAEATLRRTTGWWFWKKQSALWKEVVALTPDLLLCLTAQFAPETVALVRGSAARRKAGRAEPADGIFDLVVKSTDRSPADAAAAIFDYLAKIQ